MKALFLIAPLLLLTSSIASSEEPSISPPTAKEYCRNRHEINPHWLDQSHDYLTRKLCEPVFWFDSFFGEHIADDERNVGSFVRVRNELRWDEKDQLKFRLRVHADIKVPNATRKLRLLLTDIDPMRGDDPRDDLIAKSDTKEKFRLGLRYNVLDKKQSKFSISGGLHFRNPLEPFIRGRYRYIRPLSKQTQTRFTSTVFWEKEDGFGTSARLDWEHLFTPKTMIRLWGDARISEITKNTELGSGASIFHQLSTKKALSYDFHVRGNTQENHVDETRLGIRYRQNFYRPWLFYEIEPEIRWKRDEDTLIQERIWGLILRLEIQFERF